MFLPITKEEALKRGWDELDVIFVTGDAYIDHPAFGVPLLARWLESHGFRVGVIPQPDWRSVDAFMVLGRPRLFFAVSAGAMDSMVAHYTPARKLRHDDAYTPGNRHGARPNRACIVYTSRLKEAWRDVPVVIGGIEASLRRFAHYDFWEDKVRRSILFDSKADLLVYGMGERPLLELAERVREGEPFRDIAGVRGTARIQKEFVESDDEPVVHLPSFEEVSADRRKFADAFILVSHEMNPHCARSLVQRHGDRCLVSNPPALPLETTEMDALYNLPFTKKPHPSYREPIPAWEQIRNSITTHRGCCGGCAFCAIAQHQGTAIQSRSEDSVLCEVKRLTESEWFRGSVSDLGGPTANMYGMESGSLASCRTCRRGSCLAPSPCPHLKAGDVKGARLLRRARGLTGVKHIAVSSGIRYDLLDKQPAYFGELLAHHVGGLLKVAPEHLVDGVTALMRKPGRARFESFLSRFRAESERLGRRQHVIPYMMSGHPGCTLGDMVELALLLGRYRLRVEQVQDFTPTPGTLSTCMYYTGIDPFSGNKLHVARTDREKRLQKSLLLCHLAEERRHVLEALRVCGREDAAPLLLGGNERDGRIAGAGGAEAAVAVGRGKRKIPAKKR
ncbi:YgiQ family radical SAM protein [Geobacter sp. DSM 9736]|uniref:YgiQ family radical SAM protein n=1 Tax=Geobacter sp. DSM 9736 TaxID=1277350 RepID=UPI000B50706C|nr:YgiQ family radical SAM protein [Geobacter sp. DSM 9736]SNB46490.1 uncharacterized radical SAM protein YgiQ [Geobacter sp. DSM 9736]